MNCERFEALLDDWLAGGLSEVERRACDAHRAGCAGCDALVATMSETLGLLGPDALLALAGNPAPDLAAAIVERTSGTACGRAQSLLCDLVDATLPANDAQLVTGHLEHCARCAALHRTLVWLSGRLPELAVVQPDPVLTIEILRATAGQRTRHVPHFQALREWWQRWTARPRFAWEIAYVGTLLLVFLCGTSASPLRGVPARALAVIQLDPRAALGNAGLQVRALHGMIGDWGASAWDATGGWAYDRACAAGTDIAAQHPGMNEAWDGCRAHAGELRRQVGDRNFAGASLELRALGQDTGALWKSWTASPPASPGR